MTYDPEARRQRSVDEQREMLRFHFLNGYNRAMLHTALINGIVLVAWFALEFPGAIFSAAMAIGTTTTLVVKNRFRK